MPTAIAARGFVPVTERRSIALVSPVVSLCHFAPPSVEPIMAPCAPTANTNVSWSITTPFRRTVVGDGTTTHASANTDAAQRNIPNAKRMLFINEAGNVWLEDCLEVPMVKALLKLFRGEIRGIRWGRQIVVLLEGGQ